MCIFLKFIIQNQRLNESLENVKTKLEESKQLLKTNENGEYTFCDNHLLQSLKMVVTSVQFQGVCALCVPTHLIFCTHWHDWYMPLGLDLCVHLDV